MESGRIAVAAFVVGAHVRSDVDSKRLSEHSPAEISALTLEKLGLDVSPSEVAEALRLLLDALG